MSVSGSCVCVPNVINAALLLPSPERQWHEGKTYLPRRTVLMSTSQHGLSLGACHCPAPAGAELTRSKWEALDSSVGWRKQRWPSSRQPWPGGALSREGVWKQNLGSWVVTVTWRGSGMTKNPAVVGIPETSHPEFQSWLHWETLYQRFFKILALFSTGDRPVSSPAI